jgi:hypothetical protein
MKIDSSQAKVLTWGGVGLLVIAIGYVLVRYALPSLAGGAASGIKGALGSVSDAITSGQHDFSGEPTDAYANRGLVGDAGAVVNSLGGGLPASAGESLGDTLFSVFGSQPSGAGSSDLSYIVTFPDGSRHGVDSSLVDAYGNFTYAGQEFRLGQDGQGNHIATRRTTVYGSGAG